MIDPTLEQQQHRGERANPPPRPLPHLFDALRNAELTAGVSLTAEECSRLLYYIISLEAGRDPV